MATNIEIKARVADMAGLLARAAALSDAPCRVIDQVDTFFAVPHGRLKLRVLGTGEGELIHYQRADAAGPKASDYRINRTADPETLKTMLGSALGVIGEVRKRRHLFLVGQTRIHVDDVAGLGHFMELEVVLQPRQRHDEGVRLADALMRSLGIAATDLVAGAYLDLLAALKRA